MPPPLEPLRRFSLPGELACAAAAYAAHGFALVDGLLDSEMLDALRLEAFVLSEERMARRDGSCVLETLPPPQPADVCAAPGAFAAARSAPPLRADVARLLLGNELRALACACFAAAEAAAGGALVAAGNADTAGDVAAAAATAGCFLLNEQYIVKPGGGGGGGAQGTAFAWHADGEALPHGAPSCLSIWAALDEATASNGCLEVALRAGSSSAASLALLELPAGCAVVLSHTLPHRSGPNATARDRRAWMPQFSRAPVLSAGGAPLALAVPLRPP